MSLNMNLEQIQREMFRAIQQPLTDDEDMRKTAATMAVANEIIRPNDRLTSFERLEIYNRQYWFRLLSALAEDFPGVQAIVGNTAFEKLSIAYLSDCPSQSFTLRNLGSQLEIWLRAHPEFAGKHAEMVQDMARLEWAENIAFDEPELPRLSEADLAGLGADPVFALQPHVRLLDLEYPLDVWLLKLKDAADMNDETDIVSNAVEERVQQGQGSRPRLPRKKKTYLAVHRSDGSVYFKHLEADSYALLQTLRQGKPLSIAIENSVAHSHKSLNHVTSQLRDWFANWSALGWFCKSN